MTYIVIQLIVNKYLFLNLKAWSKFASSCICDEGQYVTECLPGQKVTDFYHKPISIEDLAKVIGLFVSYYYMKLKLRISVQVTNKNTLFL